MAADRGSARAKRLPRNSSMPEVALTPLVGLSVWWGYRATRPAAARQALRISIPIAAVMAVLWLSVIALRLLG